MSDLERRIADLEARLDRLEGRPPKPVPPPEPVRVVPLEAPPLRFPPRPAEPRVPEPPPVLIPDPPAPDLEWRFGATWLNRLGAVAILLAAAFFVSYSFKQGWITPAARCLMGGALSLALVGGGEWLRRRGQRGFSQGITGAGIGIAYVAAYGAYAFYHLIGIPAAFVLMTAATALSILVAAWGEAQAVAVLGYLGGIVTPLLLSTGQDRVGSLSLYLLALAGGAVYQGRRRGWAVVRCLAWAGSALLLAGWLAHFPLGPANRGIFTLGVLALAFLFQWDALTRIGRGASTPDAALLATNALLATTAVYVAWGRVIPAWMGTLAALGFTIQAWAGWRGWKRDPAHPAAWAVIAHAAFLLAVAVPLQFDGKGVALGWAAQALVAAWAARQYGRTWLSVHAAGTAVLALGHLLLFEADQLTGAAAMAALGPWRLTTPLACFLGVAGASLVSAVLLSALVPLAAHLMAGVASLAALAGLLEAFPGFAGTLPAWGWAGLLFAAASSRWEGARRHAWVVAGALAVKLWLLDVLIGDGWKAAAVGTALLNLRSLSTAAAAAVFAFAGISERREDSQLRAAGILLSVLCLLGGTSLEIHRLFVGTGPEPVSIFFDERFLFTALWAAGALALAWAALRMPLLRPAAWILAWGLIAKFWLSDVMLRGGWEAISVPGMVFSVRTLAVLVVAVMMGVLALRDTAAPAGLRGAAGALAVLTLLGWVDLEIHRGFVGSGAEPLRLSDGEQIAHSAAWALGAGIALAVGFLRDRRKVRIGGLVGIGLVAAKILVVDLAGVAPIYRVGILFVLGVLSLGGSYAYHRRGER